MTRVVKRERAPPQQALEDAPNSRASAPDLTLLDDVQEWSAFSQPVAQTENTWQSHLVIEGIYCSACALNIEAAVKRVAGVLSVEVSAASRRAKVVWSAREVLPSQWLEAISQAGYRALPANDALAREHRLQASRQALWRLMVAGLCMMQVMMYAYPAYVAKPGDLSAEMEHLLRWASWVLTLPVMLFSGTPFFRNAYNDLRSRRVSMDLPVALGMGITFLVSTAGTFEPMGLFGREVYFDSLTMFVFFLLTGRWLELRLRDRTAGSLEALINRLPETIERQLGEFEFVRVAVRRLKVGDVIRVWAGEAFAADGVVLQGQTTVDEALLTGESRPLTRKPGDRVISGSHNLTAVVLLRVERTGAQTRFAQIVALMESAATSKPKLARKADKIAKPFLLLVLAAAALATAYWWRTDPARALMLAVSVLVVTCPCALSLATPAAMLSAAGVLARRGVLLRRLDALESLATIDTIIFDKTGTLTSDCLKLGQSTTRPGVSVEQALRLAASLACQSRHPVSLALVRAAGQQVQSPWQAHNVVEQAAAGLQGQVWQGGDPASATELRLGSAQFCGLNAELQQEMRVYLTDAQGWLATFELHEALRDDALETLAALRRAGLAIELLSGDASAASLRVAQQLGISSVHGNCSPQDKLALLRAAQARGRRVAVVGDGLNDGPVLAGAHVSFAFGQAVPLTQAKADFLISGSRLSDVLLAFLLARRTLSVVRQNLLWAALYNAICVPLAMVGMLPAWLAGIGMASSSLLVVLNALRLARFSQVQMQT